MAILMGRSVLASRNTSYHEDWLIGVLLAPIKLAFLLLLTFLGILIVAWMVDLVFVFKVWPEGVDRLKGILNADLAHALRFAQYRDVSPERVTETANLVYELIFKATGIHDMGMRFAEQEALSIPDTIVRSTYVANGEAIEVMMIGTQLYGVRLVNLIFMMPLLALVFVIALADGLTQRAIRRASGGRESASMYHRAKHLQVVLMVMGSALSLVQAVSADPRWIWVPGAVILGVLVRLQWSYYKKHL